MLMNARKLSDQDLKQVTGGGIYLAGRKPGNIEVWEMIDDNDGSVKCTLCVDLNRENGYETATNFARRMNGVRSDYMTWDQVQALRNR